MSFLLLGLYICLTHAAEDLVLPIEFDRKLAYGENQIGATFLGDISYYYSSRPSLLAKRCNAIQYVQQVYDLAFGMSLEEYLLGKVDFRSRILWGVNQNFTGGAGFEFADVGVGGHGHEILDNNYFWLREGWFDLDLSRFMCVDKSINLIMGRMPYSVGRGISFGVVFAESPGYIGTDSSPVIEQFAPAFLLTTEIFSNKNHTMFGDIYCAILNNYAGSYEQNIDPIYSSRIWHCPDEAERGFGHINFALIGRLKYEATNKYGVLNIEPYALINVNPEASIDIASFNFVDFSLTIFNSFESAFDLFDFTLKDSNSSKLITIGCMTNWLSDWFSFNFEFAINKGNLMSYGKDNNSLFINNNFRFNDGGDLNSFGLLVCNSSVNSIEDFAEGRIINKALASDKAQEIIDNSPKGAEFNSDFLNKAGESGVPLLRNSSFRFINPKKFDYQGAMGVCDCAFWLNDEFVSAFTAGFTTGGSFDIEQSGPERKKFGQFTAKYVPDYDLTGSYGAFVSLQELYTGLWVKSAFGMGGPYPRPNKSIFWNYNAGNVNNLIFKELFNDLKFIGMSLNLYFWKKLSLQANILNYWSFCNSETLDLEQYQDNKLFEQSLDQEIILAKLPRHLGIEIFLVANIDLSYLSAFISWAVFFPGERFYSSLLSPLDYFDAYYTLNCVKIENDNDSCFDDILSTDITKFNPSYLFNAGFSYTF
jgi:hypothetical protein